MPIKFNSLPLGRVLVVGDTYGATGILKQLPAERVVGMVAASIRPHYLDDMLKLAAERGVPLFVQPRRSELVNWRRFVTDLRSLAPDGLICHSYSMIIPQEVLAAVRGRAFNFHFALLPRNRGPNPVQWSLIRGELETGVTVHMMTERLDDGPIVDQIAVAIAQTDTWVTLMARVKQAAEVLLARVIPQLLRGGWTVRPQDELLATTNRRIPRESFEIDFEKMTDLEICNLVRAQVHPLAGPFLRRAGETLRFDHPMSVTDIAELRKQWAGNKN